jgi:1,4-dihydroxy-2-naphthoate octaprenyltransferase
LFAFGAVILLFYTWPLKGLALGELLIFLVWGPVMVAGVYLVLAGGSGAGALAAALAGIPFGLCVASINIGKHIDKSDEDRQKGVHTMPVLLGQTAARWVNYASIVQAYVVTLYSIFVTHFLSPVVLIVFLAAPLAWKALALLA